MKNMFQIHRKKIRNTIILLLLIIFTFHFQIGSCEYDLGDGTGNRVINNLSEFKNTAGLPDNNQSPSDIIISLIKIVLGFLGMIFLVLIIWSGFQWMTSGGNEEMITTAKNRMKNAIIGLVIVLASYIIANAIINILQLSTGAQDFFSW